MPVLTDLAAAQVKRGVKTLYGTVLTTPQLLISDGVSAVYACDVEIGPMDPTGKINQYKDSLTHIPGEDDPPDDTTGPGPHPEFTEDDLLSVNTILHNVSVSNNNAALIYANVGSPVILTRSNSGQWEITGFSQEQPGTYHLVPVSLLSRTIGTVIDLSIDSRLLTLGELGSLRPFGQIPFGAGGVFNGGVLIRIV